MPLKEVLIVASVTQETLAKHFVLKEMKLVERKEETLLTNLWSLIS